MKEERIDQWHPAFVSALRMEFEADWDVLEFEDEYQLTDKPQSIDCVVIKKLKDAVIKNSIGRRFKRYNLFEYKSPKDEMNIDTFYKVLGYGCMFKALAGHVNEIPAEEVTLTMLRDVCPVKLFAILRGSGYHSGVNH